MDKKGFYNRWWFWAIVVLFAGFVGSRMGSNGAALTSIFGIVGVAVLTVTFMNLTQKRKLKERRYGATESHVCVHMHGIPNVNKGSLASLYLSDEKLIIEADNKTFELKYDQLTAAQGVQKNELLKEDKSVIGRGVVGGLVLGPIGAIVGGMSGIGQKDVKGDFLVINYLPTSTNEINALIFDTKNLMIAQKLARFLSERIPVKVNDQGSIQL